MRKIVFLLIKYYYIIAYKQKLSKKNPFKLEIWVKLKKRFDNFLEKEFANYCSYTLSKKIKLFAERLYLISYII